MDAKEGPKISVACFNEFIMCSSKKERLVKLRHMMLCSGVMAVYFSFIFVVMVLSEWRISKISAGGNEKPIVWIMPTTGEAQKLEQKPVLISPTAVPSTNTISKTFATMLRRNISTTNSRMSAAPKKESTEHNANKQTSLTITTSTAAADETATTTGTKAKTTTTNANAATTSTTRTSTTRIKLTTKISNFITTKAKTTGGTSTQKSTTILPEATAPTATRGSTAAATTNTLKTTTSKSIQHSFPPKTTLPTTTRDTTVDATTTAATTTAATTTAATTTKKPTTTSGTITWTTKKSTTTTTTAIHKKTTTATTPHTTAPMECKTTTLGSEYRGFLNQTRAGITCQRWDSQYPHEHSNNKDILPLAGLEENYCRNPDGEPFGPWCYTVYPGNRWDYCNIPFC